MMELRQISIKDIVPNTGQIEGLPANPRFIKDEKFIKLVESLRNLPSLTDARPVIVYPLAGKYVAIAGNMRSRAAKELKWETINCAILEEKTPAEVLREIAIKDNVSFGENDWDLLGNEWDSVELEAWGMDVPDFGEVLEAKEDDYEEPETMQVDVVLGDLIEIGQHRLLCGDSTDSDAVGKLMGGELADMVFTDPPYNIDYQGVKDKRDKIANDKMSDENFTQFLYDALNINCNTFYVCCSWQYSHLFRKAMEGLQKPVKSFIVWDKINPAQHLDKYYKQHEIILYHGKFGGQKTLRGDVWQTKRQKNTVHPTMKPIELIEMALNDNPDKKSIYDAFLGSGSTMVAAHQLNRKCYGMELDPKYCQVIIDRMQKLDPNLEIKINGKPYTKELPF